MRSRRPDDPAPPRPQHNKVAELPQACPAGPALLALAAGPWRDQPGQQPVGQGGEPEGEDRSGVHAHRARQQRLNVRWPGAGWVAPGAREARENAEHVDQADRHVLVVGAEDDGGDLADQPHQPTADEK